MNFEPKAIILEMRHNLLPTPYNLRVLLDDQETDRAHGTRR
jgi:hypothetical protein